MSHTCDKCVRNLWRIRSIFHTLWRIRVNSSHVWQIRNVKNTVQHSCLVSLGKPRDSEASLVIPNRYPLYGIFNPHLTTTDDSCNSDPKIGANYRNLLTLWNLCLKFSFQLVFVKMTINWLTAVKTYGGKRSSKMVNDNVSDEHRVTAYNYQLLFNRYHPNW